MRTLITTILFISIYGLNAQLLLYQDDQKLKLVQRGAFHIYNLDSDSVSHYIRLIERELPNHPVAPMMEAMHVLWQNIPVLRDSTFELFKLKLEETIAKAQLMDDGKQQNPEAIFFEMSARGLLAEHYANMGFYMKALDQAGDAYSLVKKGFKLDNQINDFLFTSGLYNYFREIYPEKHPIYRPFLWFFRSGDKNKGLKQLDQATKEGTLANVEAYVYLGYIYLRYDDRPALAQGYMKELLDQYPSNPYIQSKYLESLTPENYFEQAPRSLIDSLKNHPNEYYKMIGLVFNGLYLEKVLNQPNDAIIDYSDAIQIGSQYDVWGEYYKSLAYLGMGRIQKKQGNSALGKMYLGRAIDFAETEDIESEARSLLNE